MFNEFKHKYENCYYRNLIWILIETVLSSIGACFCIATITMFWNSIGMDQAAIGFVQMAFTIALCVLDIPMGYVADRFNRKALNIIGDIGVAFIFALYAFSKNMYMALVSECLLGLFMAMTNGVDQSFIRYNCDQIDETGELFKKTNIRVHLARYLFMFIATVLGGFIGKYNLRLSVGIAFIPYFIGGILAFKIKDYNAKVEQKHKNPLKDMISLIKEIIKDKKIRAYLFSYILGQEITHAQIWVFTPLLLMVGIPVEIISIGWGINFAMQIIGGKVSEKMIKLKPSKKFAIPVIIEFSWLLLIFIHTNTITVWLFILNGFVRGMIESNITTSLQESANHKIQTSLMSIASTGCRLLYIPLVYFINYLGNIRLQLALLGVCIWFLPLTIISYIQLRRIEAS